MAAGRLAVVLFNLGGPDSPAAVKPFLFNLFNDPAIITMRQPFRWLLAKLISTRRAPTAKAIYDKIGGRSPIVPLTQQQADALEKRLGEAEGWDQAKVFVTMRYWHPRAHDVARDVANFDPDQIVLLPLYPQFSTTTTSSSLREWGEAAKAARLAAPSASICCYPAEKHFVAAHKDVLAAALATAGEAENVRVLFSAHGLPKKIAESGDPYAWQVEATVSAVVQMLRAEARGEEALGTEALGTEALDWRICYQSRVGPLEWIGPSTEDEIKRAGAESKTLVVVPIAFVSEHAETLVELDVEYRKLAQEAGVPNYVRVPALGVNDKYIEALATMALEAARRGEGVCPGEGPGQICPAEFGHCGHCGHCGQPRGGRSNSEEPNRGEPGSGEPEERAE